MVESGGREIHQHDLIVARATAPGQGAIAIVRIDGHGAEELIGKLFRPRGKSHPARAERRAILGNWIEPRSVDAGPGSVIDEGITIFFRGPESFTGNDLAEMHCHGGAAVVRRLIGAAMELGARPALPGEFTRRAFLNGRIDLAQAEAVADLICAQTDAAARSAQSQLAGGLSRRVEAIHETLIELAAEIEARIDFPEEGIEEADSRRLNSMFDSLAEETSRLLASRKRGHLLREGARVALIGPPNVGKSSLLNALARTDRAIVTPHPGTTRDTVECMIDLGGIPVTLIDTAGLRRPREPVERIGIDRTQRAIGEADRIVEVRDASGAIANGSFGKMDRAPDIIVENKIDLPASRLSAQSRQRPEIGGDHKVEEKGEPGRRAPVVRVSALTGEGIDSLEETLEGILIGETGGGAAGDATPVAVGERHAALLQRASAALGEAREAWDRALPSELVMIDLRESLCALDEILGRLPNEALLDRIFERFCIGK
ncbi:tRNA uridine-5-carboxymethylaminomethyl(34) synthesis GTPase MnmE [Candidatus Sumerlaeota bacterium]|nr:tRNA uridine-5-carboxymethylaminomethyl(34) synthesis GTPase MnmE [Candidatus Sumerlaeota bacterium]